MDNKFCVPIETEWQPFFKRFYWHCSSIARKNGWNVFAVINEQLKPYGRLVTKRNGWYLRWDNEDHHAAFILWWS